MREKFQSIITDYYKLIMILSDLLLFASMWFNPELQMNHFTYFSIVSRLLFPLVVIFFGKKGIWVFYFITSVVRTMDITFDDFTALSAIIILYLFIPEERKALKHFTILCYIVGIFAVAGLHGKEPYHLFAHFVGCIILIVNVKLLMATISSKREIEIINNLKQEALVITNDEELIIKELLKGKNQNEIEFFSANTVTNKLKEARKRNGLEHTEDLLNMYKKSHTV